MSSKEINQSRANSVNDQSREEVMLEFESLDELANNIKMLELYTDGVSLENSCMVGFAPLVSKNIMDYILKKGGDQLYDKYIDKKIGHHSILRTLHFLSLPYLMNQVPQDDKLQEFMYDTEPSEIETEKWRRLVVESEKKEIININSEGSDKLQEELKKTKSSFKSTTNLAQLKKPSQEKNSQHQKFPDFNPQSIDMSVAVEFDHETETLRVLKDREMQMKYDKMILDAHREKEMKEQQQRLRGGPISEMGKKLFTYDFDGKILPQNGLKLEKLPQTLQTLTHQIFIDPTNNKQINSKTEFPQQNVLDDKKKNKNSASIQLQQLKENNNQAANYIQVKPETIMEKFELREGVTLFQNGQIKEGPKKLQMYNVGDLTQILATAQTKLKLTKKEYEQLVLGGNLSRDQSIMRFKDQNQQSVIDQQTQDQTFLNNLKNNNNNNQSNILGKLNLSGRQHSLGQIKVENQKKIYQLQSDFYEDLELKIHLEKKNKYKQLNLKTEVDKVSLIDEFNKSLLTHTHEQSSVKDFLSLPKIAQSTKPKFEEYRQTLGILSKFPRQRMTNKAISVKSQTHLPQPAIGKVMGHGINSGFNPNLSKEEKIESILDKLNNNSQIQFDQKK